MKVMNVMKQEASTVIDPIYPGTSSEVDPKSLYHPSTSYQKVLDYHIAEILLSTIVIAVIALLRLHR